MTRDRTRRRWCFRLAALLAATLLAELGARVVEAALFPQARQERDRALEARSQDAAGRPVTQRGPGFVSEDVPHPYLGFTGDPRAWNGFSEYGFWGTLGPPPPRRSPERVLVGIFGGSVAADLYEHAGETLRVRLAERFAPREVVLLNTAYGGYKQPELRRRGTELAHDGVRFTDLSGLFVEEDETVYGDDCCHFNQRGYELLAEAVAAAVLAGEGPR